MKILNPEARIFLPRLIEEMDNIVNFTMGMTLDEYKLDTKTRYAVEHAIAIASEAAGNIKKNDPQAVKKFSEFPFKELTDQRNISIHKYWKVDDAIIWATATQDIATLQKEIRKIFAQDLKSLEGIAHTSVLEIIGKHHTSQLEKSDITDAIKAVLDGDKSPHNPSDKEP